MSWTEKLLSWYYKNKRNLPWRNTRDPYFIWISEIILQQTTVNQGIPYYNKFISKYPNLKLLAKTKEEDVLKIWQGLGYYARARNLHFTSKLILKDYEGVFPSSFEELIRLKGIGDYTASAIGSIAFKLPLAAIDGNVYRFFSRYFGIKKSIDNTNSLKHFKNKSYELMDKKNPGDYNQALMEKLSRIHTIIYLEDTLENITARVRNMDTRGIVGLSKKSFEELYKERCPLYEKHAHLKIFCSGKNVHQISQEILKKIHTNS